MAIAGWGSQTFSALGVGRRWGKKDEKGFHAFKKQVVKVRKSHLSCYEEPLMVGVS